MKGGPLDHIALWTDQRDALADFLCERAGMHVIERTDAFTLVGADARKGKLTLFEAEGPREQGALGHVALRVRDPLETAVDAPGGLQLRFVHDEEGDEWDLHHVSLRVDDPEAALAEMAGPASSATTAACAPATSAWSSSRVRAPRSTSRS